MDPIHPRFRINPPPKDRPVRIYCDGIYDLFHYGHAKSLEQAKKAFNNVWLLVGVCNDSVTHRMKGKTVMTDKERYESVRHCKWADEVIEDAPWVIDNAFLEKHKIDYVAHDDIPYASGGMSDVYAFVKDQGKFLPTKRTDGVSTSELITRIVRDYDEYLRRNLARGVSPRELNIGFFKEKRIQLSSNLHNLRDEIKTEITTWKDEWKETLRTWEEKSQDFVKGFTGGVMQLLGRKSPGISPTASGANSPSRLTSLQDWFHPDLDDDVDRMEQDYDERGNENGFDENGEKGVDKREREEEEDGERKKRKRE